MLVKEIEYTALSEDGRERLGIRLSLDVTEDLEKAYQQAKRYVRGKLGLDPNKSPEKVLSLTKILAHLESYSGTPDGMVDKKLAKIILEIKEDIRKAESDD